MLKTNNCKKYDFKKKNVPNNRKIENLVEDFPLYYPNKYNEFWKKAHNKFRNKIFLKMYRKKKYVEKQIEEFLKSISAGNIEDKIKEKLNREDFYQEPILLRNNNILLIFKKTSNFITEKEIKDILVNLKNDNNYIADDSSYFYSNKKRREIIDLQDFNMDFRDIHNIRRNIRIIQLIDSNSLKLRNINEFYSHIVHNKSRFDRLKKRKVIDNDEKEYIYLDVEDFLIFDRLPEIYPDKTDSILSDQDFVNSFLN